MKRNWHSFLVLVVLPAAACSGADGKDPIADPIVVGSVIVQPDSLSAQVGRAATFTASVRDQKGVPLNGRPVTWSSSDPGKAIVSSAGVVTAQAAGRAVITATSEGRSGSGILVVLPIPANDYAIEGAQFTQGVQSADGSIPLVLSGNAAVVNVLMRAAVPTDVRAQVVLRLFSGSGALIRTDTGFTNGTLGAAPGFERPSAQILVPATALRSALRWQVELDPRQVLPDDSAGNDVFPRTGSNPLATVTVPPLKVRFVAIILAAHGNRTAIINDGLIPEYLQTLRSVQPIGAIETAIGTPLSTSASFGVAPRGGESAFWTQVLSEIELARVADPASDGQTHWFGLVNPPAGFNYTSFGGFGLIGQNQNNARSALAVNIGWFNNQAQSRELFAHELGHNFGRRHAPCNSPTGLDPSFPPPDGTIGRFGHDVFAWASGRATGAATISAHTGDIMGYCSPVWSSEYTYRGVLAARGSIAVVARPLPEQRTRVLIVRGTSDRQRGVVLLPSFALTGRPTAQQPAGSHTLEGKDADGRLLFRQAFEPVEFDHTTELRSFTMAIPLSAELENTLHSIEARGPGLAAARVSRVTDMAPAPMLSARVDRTAGRATALCTGAHTRGIAVIDAVSGALLGSASSARLQVALTAGTRITVACSDGIRTTTAGF